MLTMPAASSNPFDSATILDGIRRWVEIETPTEAPEQVNRLASLVADGYRDLPVTIERVAGRGGCGDWQRGGAGFSADGDRPDGCKSWTYSRGFPARLKSDRNPRS